MVLAYFSSAFAQGFLGVNPNNYESNWPTFNYHDYFLQEPFVAAITIDGQVVNLDTENWSALEVAAFVTTAEGQEECRSNHMWLTDEYVIEYEDPFLTIDGFPIYYNTIGGTVYFKMYDHANNIEYTECTITYLGDPYTVTAGIEVVHGWGDGLEPVILNFTTAIACPIPEEVTVNNITTSGATLTWTGTSDSYNVRLGWNGQSTILLNYDFENGSIPPQFVNNSAYAWTVVTDAVSNNHYMRSGNSGVHNSSSAISITVTCPADDTIEFDAECKGEGSSTYWDHCDFFIDDTRVLYVGSNISGWNHYSFPVTSGTHTFTWSYTKDGSVHPTGDYFAVDNIVMGSTEIIWGDPVSVGNAEYTFSDLESETIYYVTVQGVCDDILSSETPILSFITLPLCPAPIGLAATDITANAATLSWTENGAATEWQISLDEDTTNLITANSNPFTLIALTPETTYTAKVRANCGSDGVSHWGSPVTFTTASCPAPVTIDTAVCASELPLTWHGHTFDEYGSFTDTLTTADGCDSVVMLTVSGSESGLMNVFLGTNYYKQAANNERFVTIADYDSDGLEDIVTRIHPSGEIRFYKNNGSTMVYDYSLNAQSYAFSAACDENNNGQGSNKSCLTDFDNDGTVDFLVYSADHYSCTSNSVRIYWGNSTHPYFNGNNYMQLSVTQPNCVGSYSADLNNDGLADVLIRNCGPTNLYMNGGGRVLTQTSVFNTGRDINVIFDDYDLDGNVDLCYTKNGWADSQWGIRLNKGNGDGTFNSSTISNYNNGHPIDGFLNFQSDPLNDNLPDVAFTCSNDGTNSSRVYIGEYDNGIDNFQFVTLDVDASEETRIVQAFDINGDSYEDIIIRMRTGNVYSTKAYINDGHGNYTYTMSVLDNSPYYPYKFWRTGERILMAAYHGTSRDSIVVYELNVLVCELACSTPSGLSVPDVAAHTATLIWNENGTATAWQLCLNEDETNLIDVTTNPYTLTGLTPETAYTVKVRANCGSDGYSYWTNPVSFTTMNSDTLHSLLDGLVAYYPLDDDDLTDHTGNGNNGTNYGTTSTADRFCREGKARNFAGIDNSQYIEVPNSSTLQFNDAATVSLWFCMNGRRGMDWWGNATETTVNAHVLFAKNYDQNGKMFARVVVQDNGDFSLGGHISNTWAEDTIDNLQIGQWVMATFVFTDTYVETYVNGRLLTRSEGGNSFATSNGNNLYFGRLSSFWYPLNGKMDDIRVFNRALSSDEVAQLYYLDIVPPDSLLVLMPLDGDMTDYSGNGFQPVIHGNVTSAVGHNDADSTAYRFPGESGSWIEIPHDDRLNLCGSFTVSAWYNRDEGWQYGNLVSKGRDVTNGWALNTSSTHTNGYMSGGTDASAQITPSDGNWHMTTGVYDLATSTLRYYLDGELQDEQSNVSAALSTENPVAIGRHLFSAGNISSYPYPFKGTIDDIVIYNRPLSEEEVQMLYAYNPHAVNCLPEDTGCHRNYFIEDEICASELPYTWNNISYVASGDYTQTFTTAQHCDSVVTLHLTVNPSPYVTISGNTPICDGGSTSISAVVTGGLGNNSYQWYKNGNLLQGENNEVLNINNLPYGSNDTYTVEVYQESTGCSGNASSPISSLVTVVPTYTVAISGYNTVCVGETLNLEAVVSGVIAGDAPIYQWYEMVNGNPIAVTGASTPIYSTSEIQPGNIYEYSVLVTSSLAECSFASDPVSVSVVMPPAITITGTTDINYGESTTLTASGADRYEWSTGGNSIGNNAAVTVSPEATTTYFVTGYRERTNFMATATSSSSDLFCEATDSITVTVYYLPTVTTDPVSDIATFSATCGGNVTSDGGADVTGRGICWSTSQDPTIADAHTNDGTGMGAFMSTLSNLEPVTTYYVRAYATNRAGTAYGQEVAFTTPPCDPISNEFSAAICETALPYIWNDSTYTETGDYMQTFTTAQHCDSVVTLHLTVNQNPVVTISGNTPICDGGSTSISAVVTGGSGNVLNYQWQKNSTVIPNAVSEVLNIDNLAYGSNDIYSVDIAQEGAGCQAYAENPINSLVTVVPTYTVAITGYNSVCEGEALNLETVVSGVLTGDVPTYQWYEVVNGNAVAISGANVPTYSASELQPNNAYGYFVTVTSSIAECSFSSDPVSISVVTVPTLTITGTTNICHGQSTTLTASGADRYEWSTDGNSIGNNESVTVNPETNATYFVTGYRERSNILANGATSSPEPFCGSTDSIVVSVFAIPKVTTKTVSNIEAFSATCGGNVTSNGGANVTERGVCWSTSPNPTIANAHTNDGTGAGVFTSTLENLEHNTTYYVRAYATNCSGTAYGQERSFTTPIYCYPISSEFRVAVCASELPYIWNDSTYTESGDYTQTFTNANNCDSVVTLHFTVLPSTVGAFTSMLPITNSYLSSYPIHFAWAAVENATDYDLYVWPEGEPQPQQPVASQIHGTQYSIAELPNHNVYQWFMKAYNTCDTTVSIIRQFSVNVTPVLTVASSNPVNFGEVPFNSTRSVFFQVNGTALDNSITYQLTGADATSFSLDPTDNWDSLRGGRMQLTFHPTVPQNEYTAQMTFQSDTIVRTFTIKGALSDFYIFTTHVDADVYAMDSEIPIHGQVINLLNEPVAGLDVEVYVKVMEYVRILPATSDANGQFTVMFTPQHSEAGHYTVGSRRAGSNSSAEHDDFNIPGMMLVSSDWILWNPTLDYADTGVIAVRNRSQIPLTNIQVTPQSLPNGCTVQFAPLSLSGLATGELQYVVSGSVTSTGVNYEEVPLNAVSDEGAAMSFSAWYYCIPQRADLDVLPTSLVTTMTRGKSKVVDFMIYNNGTGSTGNMVVSLPSVPWMSVVGGDTLPPLAAHDSAYISIRLSADSTTDLVRYTGNFAINCERGESVSVPYNITAISDSTGTLVVDVTDEYTWNTNGGHGPHLAGANVTVKGYYSLETVATGVTDENGLFVADNLPEGWYRLIVRASRHAEYQNYLYITAGDTNLQDIFISFQAITYSFDVVPTEIEDVYTYVLNVEYETHVPKPVITMEADRVLSLLEDCETGEFNMIVTNHGLIAAIDVSVIVPQSDYFVFTPLVSHLDSLPALTTYTIPVVYQRKDCAELGHLSGEPEGQTRSQGYYTGITCEKTIFNLIYDYLCQTTHFERVVSKILEYFAPQEHCDYQIEYEIGPGPGPGPDISNMTDIVINPDWVRNYPYINLPNWGRGDSHGGNNSVPPAIITPVNKCECEDEVTKEVTAVYGEMGTLLYYIRKTNIENCVTGVVKSSIDTILPDECDDEVTKEMTAVYDEMGIVLYYICTTTIRNCVTGEVISSTTNTILPDENNCEIVVTKQLRDTYVDVTGDPVLHGKEMEGVAADDSSELKIYLSSPCPLSPSQLSYSLSLQGIQEQNSSFLGEVIDVRNRDMLGRNSNTTLEITYRAPSEFPMDVNKKYTVNLTINIAYEYYSYSKTIPISVVRPPVLFVHGLGSNGTSFDDVYKLIKPLYYEEWQLEKVDYEKTNCSAFAVNEHVVQDNIDKVFSRYDGHGYVVSKADLVGHSMGGILSRLHVEYVNNENVHKLITVNTPHSGSHFADFVMDHPILKPIACYMFETWNLDAVRDLQVTSPAIRDYLNNEAVLNRMDNIPVHAIVSTVTKGAPDYIDQKMHNLMLFFLKLGAKFSPDPALHNLTDEEFNTFDTQAWNIIYCMMNTLAYNLLYHEESDYVVPLRSQQGGLQGCVSRYDDVVTNAMHSPIKSFDPAMQKIIALLKAPTNSDMFCMNGFHPETLNYPSEGSDRSYDECIELSAKTQYLLNNQDLYYDNSIDTSDIQSDIQLAVQYDNATRVITAICSYSEDVDETIVAARLSDGNFFLEFGDTAVINIPETYRGNVYVFALGETSTGDVIEDSVIVQVNQYGTVPQQIRFTNDTLYLFENDTISPKVECAWANGDTTYITPVFQANNSLLYAANESVVGLHSGITELTAQFEGLTTSIPVIVYGWIIDDDSTGTNGDDIDSLTHYGVCASVTVQFTQRMTMTREAFEGTLTINNGHESNPMQDIDVDFVILDENGVDCTHLFQINFLSYNNMTGTNGSASLDAQNTGSIVVHFIPTKQAAPEIAKVYSFGGSFSFIDPFTGESMTYNLYPVDLWVHPSPDLYVNYFMQRDIIGDDPLTEDRVEPIVPAELGVIIHNRGAGIANNVILETAEPRIIDNEKGLAVDFAMYGAAFNGSERYLGLNAIPFGNIEPNHTGVGEWWFTSTLLGHFVSYEAHVIHNSSFGNPDLSLVSSLAIHPLIHTVYAYGNLDDGINDFLVDDVEDYRNYPDSLYFSNGSRTGVAIADSIGFDHYVTPTDTIVQLTLDPSRIGWNYEQTWDPGIGQYKLISCTRNSDQQVIPLSNVWQTFVTLPVGADPVYENRLHIVDTLSNDLPTTYTLVFSLHDLVLAVDTIMNVPESIITTPLSEVTVKFNKPIVDSTFNNLDMSLKCNNGENLLDENLNVERMDSVTYKLHLGDYTQQSGLYVLTVQTIDITDEGGYPGYYAEQAQWVQMLSQYEELHDTVCDRTDYTFHGDYLTASGWYFDTLRNESNTNDSVVYLLHLIVYHSTTSDTIANACGSFDWYEHVGITQSGDYTHTFTSVHGCDSVVTLHLTVNSCDNSEVVVTITGHNSTDDYNGAEHSVSGYDVEISDPLYTEADFIFNGTAEAARTDAGTTNMGLAAEQFVNTNSNFANVTFNVTDGYQTINPIDATVTITGHNNTADYDRVEHSASGYDVEISNPLYTEADFIFNGMAEAARTDAGTTNMGLAAEQFVNMNSNFANVIFNVTDGYQTINPIDVTVTITGHHKTTNYDGAAYTVTGYDVAVSNPLYTEEFFTFSGDSTATRTEEGTTYMGLAESQFANTNLNFGTVTFDVTDGYQTIVPADVVVVTITGHHNAAMYDGEEHNVSGYDVEISNPLYTEADFSFNGTATAPRTDAGTTNMGLAAGQFENMSTNFATVIFEVTDGYQTITQRNVTLASASDSREYNGDSLTNHNVTVGGAGFVAGEGATYEFTGGQLLPGSSSNTFTYTLNSGTLTENYNIAMVFGTLTVENRPVAERYVVEMVSNTIPVSIDEPIVYDGLEHTIEDFVTHTFTVNGHTYTVSGLTASVTQIFAGTYENAIMGDAVVTDEYGNDVTAQFDVHYTPGTLTISKRLITLTIENPEDATKVYDGTPLTITFDKLHVDGLAETDELIDGTLTSSSAEVGEYTIEDGNMFYMMATGTFTKSGFKIKHSLYPSMLAKTLASYSASISLSGSITAIECDGVTYQGHPYEAVQIGTQCWLAENLRNTATAAGPISYVAYNEDDANADAFGYLYTWYTAVGVPEGDNTTAPTTATTTSGETYVQGICPDGWAIPSHTDMEILKNFASGEVRRLRDMSTTYWIGGSEGITPNYAFNSRGGGFYNSVSGDFERMLLEAYYWESNSEPGTTEVTTLVDAYYCSDMLFQTSKRTDKRSVRCIRKN